MVTGGRAEYGLLSWLMREVAADASLSLQVVATGAHMSPRFGETWRDIEADGFAIDARVNIGLEDDSPLATAQAMGRAVAGLAEAFDRLAPDVVVLLGDRYEILAAAEAALLLRCPVAHIHGGEVTEGAFDDAMRHAITKLASLHFVACADYARRVIQLGEDPARVHVVGALGLDAVANVAPLDRTALEADLGLKLKEPLLVVTYHPTTLGALPPDAAADALLGALDRFPEATVVFTGVNADPGNRAVAERIGAWTAQNKARACWCDSLGQRRYLSLAALAAAVVGNSSSGLIEVPALRVPTVNIGDRQKGRPRATSVIDCEEMTDAIADAIASALSGPFRRHAASAESPYGAGGAAKRIHAVLRSVDPAKLMRKRFRDLPAVA